MKIHLFSAKDENVRKIMREIEHLTEDCTKLQQILDITLSLRLVFSLYDLYLSFQLPNKNIH